MGVNSLSLIVDLLLDELELKSIFTVVIMKGSDGNVEWNSLEQKHNPFFSLTFIERIQRML